MLNPSITHKLHIFSLSAFAFAQPLYDLLGKNAAFFTVRNNGITDILIFTLFLSMLIPTALLLVVEIGRLFSNSTWKFFHLCIITFLTAIITLPILKLIPAINTIFTTGFALLLSTTFTYLYYRKYTIRLYLTYLSPAALIFPLLFLLNTQTYYLLFPAEPPQIEITNIKSEIPIVMIVFDELPVSTLMSGDHQIDQKLFPGFASLAETATWHKNTSTVAEYTIQAIPALLTGNFPLKNSTIDLPKYSLNDWLDVPSHQYHPRNLFTALSSQYELRVFETISSLCPKSLCEHTYDRSVNLDHRLDRLFSDLFVVYLHIIFPKQKAKELPRIDMDWADFVDNNFSRIENIKENDIYSFQRFVGSLTPSNKPTLYFHHATLPHKPWKYLPSGKTYESLNSELDRTEDIDFRVPYQRHLLQTMLADNLLNKALRKLKQENIFDDAIIIVTADHGASFKPNEDLRVASQDNYADIMDVPFFIKYPKQNKSSISTTQLQIIDVIPILFSALNDDYPWKTDGATPENKNIKNHDKLPIFPKEGPAKYIIHDYDKKLETVNWKISLIGNNGIKGIYGGSDYAHLIGKQINTECARLLTDIKIIDKEKNFTAVNKISNRTTASIKGTVPKNPLSKAELLAITINSKIAAVLTSASIPGNSEYFHAMIDERLIKNGDNQINTYALDTSKKCNFSASPNI